MSAIRMIAWLFLSATLVFLIVCLITTIRAWNELKHLTGELHSLLNEEKKEG